MTLLSVDEMRELAPCYVMDTLSASELQQFEEGMRNTEIARAIEPEIVAHRAAIEFLAMQYAVTPPPSLRDRLHARIAAEQRVVSEPAVVLPMRPVARVTPTLGGATRVTPVQGAFTSPGSVRVVSTSKTAWWGAGVLGLALAASVVFAIDLQNRVHALQSELTQQQRIAERSTARLAEREITLRTLLDGGNDLVLVRLAANESKGPGMQVFWNTRDGHAVILASGLAQLPKNRTYALWVIRNGKPVPLKLFNPEADGSALISGVALLKQGDTVDAFAVTEEPAAGSPQPTMTPFLVGAVPKT